MFAQEYRTCSGLPGTIMHGCTSPLDCVRSRSMAASCGFAPNVFSSLFKLLKALLTANLLLNRPHPSLLPLPSDALGSLLPPSAACLEVPFADEASRRLELISILSPTVEARVVRVGGDLGTAVPGSNASALRMISSSSETACKPPAD
eukprot:COSAG02_NODE_5493_length_4284_cov_1.722342_3_plen_148_part_00